MKNQFKFIGLAALIVAATLSSCQKQDMAISEEEEFLSEETRASSESALKWESTAHWSKIPWYTECSGALQGMKVAYTSNWVYLLLKVNAKDTNITRQLEDKNEKDFYLWVYVYDKAGKQEDWYPKTTCLPEMRGWLFQKNGEKVDAKDRAAFLANADDNHVRSHVAVSGDSIYYEIAYRRSGQYAFDLLKGDKELYIAARLENSYKKKKGCTAQRRRDYDSYCPSWFFQDDKRSMYYLDMSGTATSQTKPKVVFIGDSITWQWSQERDLNENKNKPQPVIIDIDPVPLWMNLSNGSVFVYWHPGFFSQNNYINKGISGNTTSQMVKRYQTDVLEENPSWEKPSCVVIMGGTNDLGLGLCLSQSDFSQSKSKIMNTIMTNIKYMAEQAEAKDMKVVLCSVTPCNKYYKTSSDYKGKYINELNEMIKAYANEKGFAYCDYHKALVDADGVSLKAKYHLYDELHPNPDAYTVMEQIIQPIIKEVLAK